MLDVFNIAKPQNCDIQTFYGTGATIATSQKTWIKPRGVSNVYMLLIGAGGNGNGTTGGGSGAVTVWYGAAQNVPDSLVIEVPLPGSATRVSGKFAGSSLVALLTASFANASTAGAAMTANQFAASGFFQSIAGQAGNSGAISASSTTFLSGGSNGTTVANYGYSQDNGSGIFQMQPIIVGLGGAFNGKGGIGCGGGSGSPSNGAVGGPGMVLIASW